MIQQTEQPETTHQSDKNDCLEKDNLTPTQKSIVSERIKYCDELYNALGIVNKWEAGYLGQQEVFKEKRRLFVRVEKNYQILRNFNITIGSEFMQTNETLKTTIGEYLSKNSTISETLKKIATEVGVLKDKMKALREQACKLEACRDDSCNKTQWEILIGKQSITETKDQQRIVPPENCKSSEEFFNKLICLPKSLVKDVDSIFKSSADVKGIQVFSNITPLEPMRVKLSELVKKLDAHMQESMKLRETDIKKIQDELISIIKEGATINVSRYDARSDFEGITDALKVMCCLKDYCECVKDIHCDPNNQIVPRLENCEQKICEICREVKKVYCDEKDDHQSRQSDKTSS